jgi:hypothetical protein
VPVAAWEASSLPARHHRHAVVELTPVRRAYSLSVITA